MSNLRKLFRPVLWAIALLFPVFVAGCGDSNNAAGEASPPSATACPLCLLYAAGGASGAVSNLYT